MRADLADLRNHCRIFPDVIVVDAPCIYEPPIGHPNYPPMPPAAQFRHGVYEQTFPINQDGPFVVFDVMATRADVVIELWDLGAQRCVAKYAGPWLAHRQLALAELLETVVDMASAKRTQNLVSVLKEAISRKPEWIEPCLFPPNSALQTCIVPLRGAPEGPCTVWLRGEKWSNL